MASGLASGPAGTSAERSTLGSFWVIPPAFLSGTAATAGIAMTKSIGNLGGFVGPCLLGMFVGRTAGQRAGLLLTAASLILGGVLTLSLKSLRGPSNTISSEEPNHDSE